MTRAGLAIKGSGLGAVVAAASLERIGHPVTGPEWAVPAAPGPTLVLNEKTLWMIGNLFGVDVLRDIVAEGIGITHRRLRWAEDRIETLPENSLSLDAARLAARLVATTNSHGAEPVSTIRACGRRANTGAAFRPQTAFVWDLPPSAGACRNWCATISVGQAWAALAPAPSGWTNLQVYVTSGAEAEARVAGAEAVGRLGLRADTILSTAPRCMDAAARLGTLWEETGCAVGDEALALDPLAGDGVGNTIRAALWVSTLLSAEELSDGMRREIYHRRMVQVFQQHQAICARYYGMMHVRDDATSERI